MPARVRFLIPGLLLLRVATSAAAQTPVNALSLPTLLVRADTVETYSRRGPGPLTRGASYVRTVTGSRDRGWRVEFRWSDSARAWMSTQRIETAPGTLATRSEHVRALIDSASLLIADGWATGWIVPAGQPARLIDGAVGAGFASGDVAMLAIAASHPQPGMLYTIPRTNLFSGSPLAVAADTLQALAPTRLRYNNRNVDCQSIHGPQGRVYWVERATGRLLARRAISGPVTYWHVVAGVTPPEI
jgi:hypothetical protein